MDKLKLMKEKIDLLNKAAGLITRKTGKMTNLEYDRLYDELLELERKPVRPNSPTSRVGYELLSACPRNGMKSPCYRWIRQNPKI